MIQKLKNFHGLVIILAILFVFAGCSRYYKAITTNAKDNPEKSLDSLKNQNRYFILRTPSQAWYMRNIVLSEDRKTLTCALDSLP
jgi:PBP1b-binding outer membrane lipoprotein LpoB